MLPAQADSAHTPPSLRSLAVSVVTYRSDRAWLERTLSALRTSALYALEGGALERVEVTLAINDDAEHDALAPQAFDETLRQPLAHDARFTLRVIDGHGNVGYGHANNLALRDSTADVLLVLNPDVVMEAACITEGLRYLAAHPACAMVSPVATDEAGVAQSLIKDHPNVLALALRGTSPSLGRTLFPLVMREYERGQVPFDAPLTDGVIVSGCFMLMRRDAWVRSGGFDETFFLYFEDFDLSKRISAFAQIHRVPTCRIVHAGGNAARKGRKHIGLFARSAARFFQKHGWRWW